MIMTAGHGTRLRPFTGITSKPLLPILSIPTIHLIFDHLAAQGVIRSICNLHSHFDETKKEIENYYGQMDFMFSDERKELLGSWGGVVTAGKQLSGDQFYWINGDVLSNADLGLLGQKHFDLKKKHPKLEMTLLVCRSGKTETEYREIEVDRASGLVTKAGQMGKDVLYYASSAVIEKHCLDQYPSNTPLDFMKDYLLDAIRRGVVGFLEQPKGIWMDIGSPELWARAHFDWMKLMEEDHLPQYWKDSATTVNTRLAKEVWVHKDLAIPEELVFREPVYLGLGEYSWSEQSEFGPALVLYGLADTEIQLAGKISFSKMSVQFSNH